MKSDFFYNEQYSFLGRDTHYASIALEDTEIFFIEKQHLYFVGEDNCIN